MGIDLELHSARPARDWGKARTTLLRSSYGHGEALADALGSFQYLGISGGFAAVDLYGNTVWNEQQAVAALSELSALKQRCSDERQLAALDDLATMLRECSDNAGSFLWFQGG